MAFLATMALRHMQRSVPTKGAPALNNNNGVGPEGRRNIQGPAHVLQLNVVAVTTVLLLLLAKAPILSVPVARPLTLAESLPAIRSPPSVSNASLRSRRAAPPPLPFPVGTADYMLEHAAWLRAEAERIERDPLLGQKGRRRRRGVPSEAAVGGGGKGTTKAMPVPVHFVTYASGPAWNLTMVRLVRQAARSGWFDSVRGYVPSDLPPDFVAQYSDVLSEPRGAGYWLWRYPVLEMTLRDVPVGDYAFFLDAGSELNGAGGAKLARYLERLEGHETKEIMRFEVFFTEASWTAPRVFEAFNCTRWQWAAAREEAAAEANAGVAGEDGPSAQRGGMGRQRGDGIWPGRSSQLLGGIWIYRNGPALRRFLAFVYDALRPDPAIVTDRYNGPRGRNRHDQSVSSVAAKLMDNYLLGERSDQGVGRGGPEPFKLSRLKNLTWEKVKEMERMEADNNAWGVW